MTQAFEQYRIAVKYPYVDSVWQKAVGVSQRWKELSGSESTMVINQIKRMALQFAYDYHYDMGCIVCLSRENGRIQLVDIVPVTIVMKPFTQKDNEVYLGADPEFILMRHGHPLIAEHYLPVHGQLGVDSIRLTSNRHIPALAELRPHPEKSSERLTRRIAGLIKLADDYIVDTNIQFIAGSMPLRGLPIGGHIHLSGVACSVQLIRCLDNYLALPLALLESKEDTNRRPKYGFPGDIRIKGHGGFEYRTLPSWLESPKMTLGVFEMVQFIVHFGNELRQRPLSKSVIKNAFMQNEGDRFVSAVNQIWDEISRYQNKWVNFERIFDLFTMIRNGKKWSKSTDFRRNWQ